MPIFHFNDRNLLKVEETSFSDEEIRERKDIQAALKKNISVISDDLLVIAEEFSNWTQGQRRIDLLAIDKEANVVVIELKRTDTGDYMELQAVRYAAMISQLTWKEAINIFSEYLQAEYPDENKNAEQGLLGFLGWSEPREDDFGAETHILLVSADFSDELTTSVLWLNGSGLNIKCVQISPHKFEDKILVNVQQIIPIPETEDYQIRVRRKGEEKKIARHSSRDLTRYIFKGEEYNKRKLVLAVIMDWVESKNPQNIRELMDAFPQDVGPGGTFSILDKADAERYFTREEERIRFNDGTCYVISNQWGASRHERFVEISRKLGYTIEEVAT